MSVENVEKDGGVRRSWIASICRVAGLTAAMIPSTRYCQDLVDNAVRIGFMVEGEQQNMRRPALKQRSKRR